MNQLDKPAYRWPDLSYYPWLVDLVEEFHINTGTDRRMILGMILSIISFCLQVPYRAKCPSKDPMSLVLFIWIIAGSGVGKSELFKPFIRMLLRHQNLNIEAFTEKWSRYLGEIVIWKADSKILESKYIKTRKSGHSTKAIEEKIKQHQTRKPKQPRKPVMVHNDSSIYSMLQEVMENHVALFLASSDAYSILEKKEFKKLMPILLDRFSDMDYSRGRKNEGRADLSRTYITVLLMIQENMLMDKWKDIGELGRESGLWARTMFNMVRADENSEFTPPEDPDWTHLNAFKKRVEHFLNLTDQFLDDPDKQPTVFEYSPEAGEYNGMFIQWRNEHKKEGGAFFNMKDVANRMAEISGRIATGLHIFSLKDNPVELEAIKTGIDIYMAYLPDLVKIVDCEATHIRNARKLYEWLKKERIDKGHDHIAWYKILKGLTPSHLRPAALLNPALEVLTSKGVIHTFKCDGQKCLYLAPEKFFDFSRARKELYELDQLQGKIDPPLNAYRYNPATIEVDYSRQEAMPIPHMSIAPYLPREWPEALADMPDEDQSPSGREFDHFIKYLQ